MSESLLGFDLDRAVSNFAADTDSKKWLCGRNPKAWKCPYRNKVKYYVLEDENGNAITSSREREKLEPKENQKIKAKLYTGCPKFEWENR